MLIWNEEVYYLFSASETDNLREMNILIISQGIEIVLWYLFNDNFNALSNVLPIRNNFFIFRIKKQENNQLQAYSMHIFLASMLHLKFFLTKQQKDYFFQGIKFFFFRQFLKISENLLSFCRQNSQYSQQVCSKERCYQSFDYNYII